MDRFETEYILTVSDVDINYKMTPNAISLYFQDCLARYMSIKRVSPQDLIEDNLIWVMTDVDMHFIGPRPLWMQKIKVEIRFCDFSSVKEHVRYRISVDERVFVEGSSCWIILDRDTKHPVNAGDFLKKTDIPQTGPSDRIRRCPLSSKSKLFNSITHDINITDVDFNGHMSNRSYLMVAMETAPENFINTSEPVYVNIKFIKECFLGDRLTCNLYTSTVEPHHYWNEIKDGEGEFVCRVYSEWKRESFHAPASHLTCA